MRAIVFASVLLSLFALVSVFAGEAAAQGNRKGPQTKAAPADPKKLGMFTQDEMDWVRYVYNGIPAKERPRDLPRQVKTADKEKRLQRGQKLPPGWAQKVVPFHPEIERRMGLDPAGGKRGYVEGYAVS